MPNEGHEHEIAPEEENRARFAHPKMREQIVDLLAGLRHTLPHTLIISPSRVSPVRALSSRCKHPTPSLIQRYCSTRSVEQVADLSTSAAMPWMCRFK